MKQIPLTQGLFAAVDDDDFEWLSQWKWSVNRCAGDLVYAARRNGRKHEKMHRLIMGFPSLDVDHKDGNGLNNQRDNLRIGTRSQNAVNRGPDQRNSSGFKGVSLDHGRWRARIRIGRVLVSLGHYGTAEEAARAYDTAAIEHFGDFAYLNLGGK
jgi:hypothetical protein